ncbi:hypothetical protein A2153_05165 [Candidatus Gottesmanbacteria bacterium RBG_16_38_7b]|uniref:DUF2029 domain-containing protein n=1 Tax=Candidatus Gottesmanbacteria bacterium RBG_16_38_7b TaxID=1798372 RepID=A0A1F5YGT0_9BACT|nr:MAG: hypothetical protein A2153_05165 [Candidatus Gottesmanbacteria bacterium RBG_16_38_7b]
MDMSYRSSSRSLLLITSALLLFLSILQITFGLDKHLRSGLIDFDVYYQYGRILLSGRSPYGPEFTQGIPFNYPPSSFILFAPFALFSNKPASLLFTAFSLFFFIISAYLLLKHFFPSSKPIRLLLLSLLLQNFPTKFTLVTGQINLIILSILFLSFLFDQKNRPVVSGLLWSLACILKLTPLTLILYFLLRRRFLSVAVGLSVFLFTNLFFLALTPRSFFYLTTHLPALLSKSGAVTTLYDHSLRAFLARLGITPNTLFSNLTIFTLFVLIILKRRTLTNLSLFSLILIATTIGNAFAWQHHFVLTFPAFIVASLRVFRTKNLPYFFLTLLSAILVGMHFADIARPPTTNPFLISHALLGSILLYLLLIIPQHPIDS